MLTLEYIEHYKTLFLKHTWNINLSCTLSLVGLLFFLDKFLYLYMASFTLCFDISIFLYVYFIHHIHISILWIFSLPLFLPSNMTDQLYPNRQFWFFIGHHYLLLFSSIVILPLHSPISMPSEYQLRDVCQSQSPCHWYKECSGTELNVHFWNWVNTLVSALHSTSFLLNITLTFTGSILFDRINYVLSIHSTKIGLSYKQ